MLRSTRDIRVIVLTDYWSKGYTRDDGKEVEPGWTKSRGWPARGSTRPDGNLNDFSQGARKSYHECSLYQALTHHATTPAYFVGYQPTNIGLRIRKDALQPLFYGFTHDAGGIRMHLALFDIDNHDELADIEVWFDSELAKLDIFLEEHPGAIVYRSRRGYRILAVLPQPVILRNQHDANQWTRTYTAWVNYIRRCFNINVDYLTDWTRYQAVPHTVKEKGQPALDLEIIGDVENVGVWSPTLDESDWPPERKSHSDFEGVSFEGESQLLKLVRMTGLRCDPTESSQAWDICCPNWLAHSPDSRGLQDYPTKTILYTNGPIGAIECKSSGCRASHPNPAKDYLRHFSEDLVRKTRPLGPIDVLDPAVLRLSDRRNRMCSNVKEEKWGTEEDSGFEQYEKALKNQRRLGSS